VRILFSVILLSAFALAQDSAQPEITPRSQPKDDPSPTLVQRPQRVAQQVMIPAGTRIPIALKNTISTKANHEGDPIYAQSTFPVAINDRIIVPAGTYVQGKIISIKPAGHIKGRAEVLIHFTSLIYPSGYTVMLPGAIENAPGVDNAKVKDKEGTIQGDSNKGKTAATIAAPAANGALIGAVARGGEGALIGAGIGGAIGTAIAAFSHGNEVKMMPGTTLEVVLQRDVPVDGARISRAYAERY
jgi:type IV secretion system protein VirB10